MGFMVSAIVHAILVAVLHDSAALLAMAPRMVCGQVVFCTVKGWHVNGLYAGESVDSAARALGQAILADSGLTSFESPYAPSAEQILSRVKHFS